MKIPVDFVIIVIYNSITVEMRPGNQEIKMSNTKNMPFGLAIKPGTFQVFTPDGWVHVCGTKTWRGAHAAVAGKVRRASAGYGGMRRADGGPDFGAARFLTSDGEVWRVDYDLGCPVPPASDIEMEGAA